MTTGQAELRSTRDHRFRLINARKSRLKDRAKGHAAKSCLDNLYLDALRGLILKYTVGLLFFIGAAGPVAAQMFMTMVIGISTGGYTYRDSYSRKIFCTFLKILFLTKVGFIVVEENVAFQILGSFINWELRRNSHLFDFSL